MEVPFFLQRLPFDGNLAPLLVKYFGVIGGVIGTVLCLIGTATGLMDLMRASTALSYMLSIGMSVMFVILLLGTQNILKGRKPVHTMLRFPLLISILLVMASLWVFTSNMYLKDAISGPSVFDAIVKALISCASIILLSGAPVYLSYLIPIHVDSTDSESK